MKVAITGATGFTGRQIINGFAALAGEGGKIALTALVRDELATVAGARVVRGDLSHDQSVADLVRHADVLVHAASYVSTDEVRQGVVNVQGTARLVAAARDAGVARIVYLSTAGVYGGTFARGGTESELAVSPRSPLSRSRRDAEDLVLECGGTVVRPNMVTGPGDRWFLLPLLRAMESMGGWIENGSAKVSVISSRSLGLAIASLAARTSTTGVFHAANLEPITIRDLVAPVYAALERPLPSRSIDIAEARARLAPAGITESALAVIASDNWFDSSKLWQFVSTGPDRSPLLAIDAEWYARLISQDDAPDM